MANDAQYYKDLKKAHDAVYAAIKAGNLPHASDLLCEHCNKNRAEQYHHHGYEPKNRLDVIALCVPCHIYVHRGESEKYQSKFIQCKALSRTNKRRCTNWAMGGSDYCGAHTLQAKMVKRIVR